MAAKYIEGANAVRAVGAGFPGAGVSIDESWLQPPIALYVLTSEPDTWQQIEGVDTCSSSTEVFFAPDPLESEFAAWDVLSDEAFLKFERSLEK